MKTLGDILKKFERDAEDFITSEKTKAEAKRIEDKTIAFFAYELTYQAFLAGAKYGFKLGKYDEYLNAVSDEDKDGDL